MGVDGGELEGRTSTSVTGELDVDLATHRSIVRAALGRKLWLLRGIGVLSVALGVTSLVVVGAEATVGAILEIVLGLLVISSDELTARLGWRRLRAFRGGSWRYEVSVGGVRIRTPVSDVGLRRDVIRRVDRRPGVWVLVTTSRGRLAIPRAAFTPDDARRADQLLGTAPGDR
jgi:hypothetical protein